MSLLKWHIQISIICLLGIEGVKIVLPERLKRAKAEEDPEDATRKSKMKKMIKYWIACFCPVLNVIMLISMIYLAFCSDEMAAEVKRRAEEKNSHVNEKPSERQQ